MTADSPAFLTTRELADLLRAGAGGHQMQALGLLHQCRPVDGDQTANREADRQQTDQGQGHDQGGQQHHHHQDRYCSRRGAHLRSERHG